jgi:hypothetical protein
MSTLPAPQALFPREWPSLPLYLDWGQRVAICTLCQYAISVDGTQASSHFRKRHQIPSEVKYFIIVKDRPEDKASDATQIANFI